MAGTMNSLNGWLNEHGYKWVAGKEELYKGIFVAYEADEVIQELLEKGVIERA